MHAKLESGDLVIMAADMMDPSSFKKGDTVSLCIVCGSEDEIKSKFNALSDTIDPFRCNSD